jgi:membrane protein YqaA with SNARE-associated domain
MEELFGLFLASFAAATLVPLPSEAALYAYLKAFPEHTALAVAVATVGNTAGGMTSYLLGRLIPEKNLEYKYIQFVKKHGSISLAFAWLPFVGDALCVAAGWLRMNWIAALAFMAAGRLARYIAVAALT